MPDNSQPEGNEQFPHSKPRTREEFIADATILAEHHSRNPQSLIGHLRDWELNDYDPKMLSQNILTILTQTRNELNNRQIRCDVSLEQLQRNLVAIRDHTIEQHIEDVIIARQLVEWCETYAKASTERS